MYIHHFLRYLLFFVLLLSFYLFAPAQAAQQKILFAPKISTTAQNKEIDYKAIPYEDWIVGVWQTGDGRAKVEIYKTEDERYEGKIVWLKKPNDSHTQKPLLDRYNPDTSLRKRPLMGLVMLTNISYAGEGVWNNVHAYDPSPGRHYEGIIKMDIEHKKMNMLILNGYLKGLSMIKRQSVWSRVQAIVSE